MMHEYEKKIISELANQLLSCGFRVFIAERGHYGFFTDQEGTRVVCFGVELGTFRFSGNYKSLHCGSGWMIRDGIPCGDNIADSYNAMLFAIPPHWATKGERVSLTTLKMHLHQFQKSSRYTELQPANREVDSNG